MIKQTTVISKEDVIKIVEKYLLEYGVTSGEFYSAEGGSEITFVYNNEFEE